MKGYLDPVAHAVAAAADPAVTILLVGGMLVLHGHFGNGLFLFSSLDSHGTRADGT